MASWSMLSFPTPSTCRKSRMMGGRRTGIGHYYLRGMRRCFLLFNLGLRPIRFPPPLLGIYPFWPRGDSLPQPVALSFPKWPRHFLLQSGSDGALYMHRVPAGIGTDIPMWQRLDARRHLSIHHRWRIPPKYSASLDVFTPVARGRSWAHEATLPGSGYPSSPEPNTSDHTHNFVIIWIKPSRHHTPIISWTYTYLKGEV
jgi:hypothetical protein